MTTLYDLLAEAEKRWPDKPAAVFSKTQVTYAQLAARGRAIAARLERLDIGPGRRVALLYDNSLAALSWYWGIQCSGAVTVDIPSDMSSARIDALLRESRPDALAIQANKLEPMLAGNAPACPAILLSTADGAKHGATLGPRQELHLLEEILDNERATQTRSPRPSGVAMIIYTSGTTGSPKGVMLGHDNILFNLAAFNSRLGLTERDSLLLVAPLHYIHGRIQLLTFTMLGGTLHVSAGFRFPVVVLNELVRHASTTLSGVPYHFMMLLTRTKLASTPLPALRTMNITGGALPPARLRELQDAVPNAEVHVNYGMTEASPRLTHLGPSKDVFRKPASCGRALPRVTLVILGDDERPVPPGVVGEVVASSPGIMQGYVSGDERSSGRIDARGRLRTGDLGYLDTEGYLHLTGRLSEVIKSAGERLFPGEIEDVLHSHPGVSESAVFGVDHPVLGQSIVACIVPEPGHEPSSQELKSHCLQTLPHVRTPHEFHIVAELPKTPSGKVRRGALATMFTATHGHA